MTKVPTNVEVNKGAWTAEEDRKLSEIIALHGARRWQTIAAKAGLNRCGKSCRLRWMNYLRPNIKRGNISDQEEDLILRLHKLLGNRWSLIAGRLPGRTDNEIKNYWNSHLSKKINHNEKRKRKNSATENLETRKKKMVAEEKMSVIRQDQNPSIIGGCDENSNIVDFNVDELFDFSSDIPLNLEWVSKYLELEEIKFK